MRALDLDAELLARPDEGRRAAEAVVADARRARHPEAEIVALRALGWAHREVFAYDDAETALARAYRLARRERLDGRLVDVLITRAGLRLQQGQSSRAQRDLARARSMLGDRPSAELEFLQARIEQEVGRLIDAAASYERALLARPAPLATLRVKILNNYGGIELTLGHVDNAERLLREGRDVAATIGPAPLAYLTHSLGNVALQRGHLPQALRQFDEGDEAVAAAGLPPAEFNLARLDALLTSFLVTEAMDVAERVVASLRPPGNELLLAQALMQQSNALMMSASYERAAAPAAEARALFVRQQRPAFAALAAAAMSRARMGVSSASAHDVRRAESAALTLAGAGFVNEAIDANLVAGRIALELGRVESVGRALGRAVTLADGGPIRQRLKGRVAEALLARHKGDAGAVRRTALRGLRELETYRATLASAELRALASGHGAELASLGLDAALANSRPGDVLHWLERGRGRSLLAVPARTQSPAMAAALAELRGLATQQSVDDMPTPDELSALRLAQTRLEREVLRLARTVDAEGSGSASAASPAEIRSALGDRGLVEFGVHDGRVLAVTATTKRMRLFPLALASEVEIEQDYLRSGLQRLGTARDERAVARARAASESALSRLDDLLLSPLRRELDGTAAAVVVPTARLLGVAWPALPSLRGREVVVSPAAGLWLVAEQRALAELLHRSVALVAGPLLPGAVAEVEALAELHRGAKALTPPDSTVGAVLSAIDGAALAHLACHGRFRADNPTFSALDMADGPLTVHDLEQIDRLPRCLVLAACDSGLSEAYPGEELLGFLARLLAGGTATVIASVVPVPDVDTVPLMLALHRALRAGTSPAAALARARAAVVDSSAQGFLAATAFACFGSG